MLCAAGESNLRAGTPNYAASSQHRELSWWGNIFYALHPGPKHHASSSSVSGGDVSDEVAADESVSDSSVSYSDGSDSDGSDNTVSASTSSVGATEAQANYLVENENDENGMVNGSSKAANVWIFIVGALFAAAVGTAFMTDRERRRRQQDAAQPLAGSRKKQRRNKGTPAFVEIATVQTGSYAAPQEAETTI